MIATNDQIARETENWAYIAGRWNLEDGDVNFLGPLGTGQPAGIAISSLCATDCEVDVAVRFETMNNEMPTTSAGVILGYTSPNSPYAMVQLGGWHAAYSLGEYVPAIGWRALARYGSLENLRANVSYQLKVVLRGQSVTFFVDEVRIFEHLLARPLTGGQIGLFAYGSDQTRFHSFKVLSLRPKLFVAMPFSDRFSALYTEVIKEQAEAEGFDVRRIDEVTRPGIIFQDIQHEIADSTAVIAEISEANSNVFYELGYAHALNKPTILLARRDQQLPFDIRSYRVIFYDDSIGGKPRLERTLVQHLQSILHGN